MDQPFISICVPVYNGETYLRECLDSCISQDYFNYEVLVCDDGSSDGSVDFIKAFQSKYPALRFYQNKNNLGLVGNWNRCIELAKGEWIKLVFQDDYILQNCLSEFVSRIKHDTQLLVSKRNFLLPNVSTKEQKEYYQKTVRTLENTCGKSLSYSAQEISSGALKSIGMNFIAEPSLSLFKKSVLVESGSFNPLLKQICDLEFLLRLGSQYGLEYIPEAICAFRIHEGSTTNTNLNSKYFELRFIEPVLYSWILLYSEAFRKFRSQLNALEKIKLGLYFRLKCFQAGRENARLQLNHKVFDVQYKEFSLIQKTAKSGRSLNFIYRILRKG
jgi:glycosyltransferase involved in cell wall biosynthesis